ncbi:MAG TPA: hypothetical protein VJN65_07495 [Bacteroidota bacterium]|nr:hypothetical protein [Bacteroidota bacterium]
MGKFDREYQKRGDLTPLEISEKAYHDEMVEYLKEQKALAKIQGKYTNTITKATDRMATATWVIAISAITQVLILLLQIILKV